MLSPVIGSLEERVGALAGTLSAETMPEQRITLVVIDEASIAEIGPWPWSRADMASLVQAIDDAGAQLRSDISYPENRPGDAEFESSLAAASGVVIAHVLALGAQSDAPQAGVLTHSLAGVSCDARTAGSPNLWSASGYVGSAAIFEGIPKGHNAAIIEADGSVRRSPAVVCVEGRAIRRSRSAFRS